MQWYVCKMYIPSDWGGWKTSNPSIAKKSGFSQVPTDVEKCQDRVECFNADLKADMERWQNSKRQDFRQLLMGMADKNIQYYEKVTPQVAVILIAYYR